MIKKRDTIAVDQMEECAFLRMCGISPLAVGYDPDRRRVAFQYADDDALGALERFRAGQATVDPLGFTEAMRAVKKIIYAVRQPQRGEGGRAK